MPVRMASLLFMINLVLVFSPMLSDGQACSRSSTYKAQMDALKEMVVDLSEGLSQNCETTVVDCPRSHYVISRGSNIQDYIQYSRHFPRLTAATMCIWINLVDVSHLGPIMGYESLGFPNHILMELVPDRSVIRLIIAESLKDFTFRANANQTYHICGWFDSAASKMGYFIDGESIGTQTYTGAIVGGGGNFVLGQDEDRNVANRFWANRSVRGSLANAVIFPRVLTKNEIRKMRLYCKCPADYQVAMTLDKVELHGEASYSTHMPCPF